MKNILLTIKQKLSSLPEAERKVGKYILENSNEIVEMSASQLAKASNSSPATVIRFSKSINNSGFPQLKMILSSTLNNDEDKIIQEINPKDTVNDLKDKIEARISHTVQQSGQILKDSEIKKAIKLIQGKKYIVSYGISASGLAAQDFAQKFIRLGKSVVQNYDTHVLATGLSANKATGLLVLVSNSGSTLECCNLLNLANNLGIKSIVMSHSKNSYLAKNCDVFLEYNAGQEQESLRTAATTSLIAQMYTINLLYYSYFCMDYDKNLELIKTSSQTIKKFVGEK